MRRREFIKLFGNTALAWPLAARAQQADQMRHIGVLMSFAESDPEAQARVGAFRKGLQELGWAEGRNIRIDICWAADDAALMQRFAKELVALHPDFILSHNTPTTASLLQQTRTIPIVFAVVSDPVGAGFVSSLARPGGNVTGFTQFDYSIAAKWLALLKEIAPNTTRAAVLRDPAITAGIGQWATIQSVSSSIGVEVSPISLANAAEMDTAVTAFARSPNGGLIATGSALTFVRRDLIIALAARYRLPAVYYDRAYASAGGLISYGSNNVEQFRSAATYVDRILKGEKPADLPVQTATKYELIINLKTAKALGLDVPSSLLARADEVIE